MTEWIDPLTPEQRRHAMRQVRSEDTKPEMRVRRLTHRMGYRYRLHRKDLPGKPDLVFPGRKKVIFVHGCFWHGHDCPAGRKIPKTNQAYWTNKLNRNKERDRINQAKLRELGWDVLVIWECETKDEEALAERIVGFLDGDRS
ncbi:MAG TPA: DNA mismatch endonuclease Vsr [Anaerolineae bacterium]|nr:DNA mismatch endonuclease Vsr [Anaerolineae bacterium]